MLTLKALGIKDGEVLIPSFTFPATAHAVHWSNLKIRLIDCDPKKFTIDVNDLQEKITDKTKVIMPVNIFGNPCDIEEISQIAKDNSLKVVYDSAHGFGAKYRGKRIGQFGDAEVFSGSPTKAFTTVEGGIVSTNDSEIARKVDIGRNYGHSGNYNCEMPGLSARMSELHAAVGLNQLPYVDSDISKRNALADAYKRGLRKVPGIRFQELNTGCTSTYKDFAVLIDPNEFGLNRDELSTALDKENVMTRKYFYPPINMQDCYPELKTEENAFPNTSKVSRNVLSLPMFSELTDGQISGAVDAIARVQAHANEVRKALSRRR
jgi:dTDP-4-amino-4,6-dideoxygalactose transaminase